MSHWAELDNNNVVLRVLVGDDSESDRGESTIKSLGGTWVETSIDGSFRKNYAGVGYTYDESLDAFIPPMPVVEGKVFHLDKDTCTWNWANP